MMGLGFRVCSHVQRDNMIFTLALRLKMAQKPHIIWSLSPKASKWVVVKIRVPFLCTLNNRCRTILRTQKGTIILTTTQI